MLDVCCRQEVEELRYEQERLRWQLNQASHLGTTGLPLQIPDTVSPAPESNYCSHAASDRYIIAKHTAIYPTAEDVRTYHYITLAVLSVWFVTGQMTQPIVSEH